MPDTKIISTSVLLTVCTGLALPGVRFPATHEAIEHVLGEPVWTHMLASQDPWDRARAALASQHPQFSSVDGEVVAAACKAAETVEEKRAVAEAWMEAEIARLGVEEFVVKRGVGRSDDDVAVEMVDSLRKLGKPIIATTN